MSRREVVDCDRCKKETLNYGIIWVATGHSSDPAGGPSTEDEESIDLCAKCLVALINHMKGKIVELSYDQGKAIVNWVKTSYKDKP